jgi:hypothetical protein
MMAVLLTDSSPGRQLVDILYAYGQGMARQAADDE